jgi:hypothetical protein
MSGFVDRLRSGTPVAATSAVALLASFGVTFALKETFGLSASVLVLAVVLALSMSRREASGAAKITTFALLALPLASVGATEVGTQVYQNPNVGDALFVLAVTLSVWVRRFSGPVARLGAIAGLPLIAILVAPAGVAGSSSGSTSRWWPAAVACVALVCVTASFTIATRAGWLRHDPATQVRRTRPARSVIDRMALRLFVSLALAFTLGRWLFGAHWPWLVITAYVVCSGGAEHADVWARGLQRIVGAAVGTLVATLVSTVAPTGSPWTIVAILAVLVLVVWLRPINYAFWAAGVTSVLALLYGYYGERGDSLLLDRLEEIALGAVLAVAISWLVTLIPIPEPKLDPVWEATTRVLGYVNRQHGLRYRLVRPVDPGLYLVRSAADGDAVLWWSRDRSASAESSGALASGATPSGYPYALTASKASL